MRCSGMEARRGCRRFGGWEGEGLRRQNNAGVVHPDSAAYLRQTETPVSGVEVSQEFLPTKDGRVTSSAWTVKHLEREALEGGIGCVKSAGDSCVG